MTNTRKREGDQENVRFPFFPRWPRFSAAKKGVTDRHTETEKRDGDIKREGDKKRKTGEREGREREGGRQREKCNMNSWGEENGEKEAGGLY